MLADGAIEWRRLMSGSGSAPRRRESDVLAEISQCPRRQTLGTACEAVFIDLAKVNNENMPIPMSS